MIGGSASRGKDARPRVIHRLPQETVARVVEVRRREGWCSEAIEAYLKARGVQVSHSSIHTIIKQNHLPMHTYKITTKENGFIVFRWNWYDSELGTHWIVKITASKPGYNSGSTVTSIYAPLPSDRLQVEINDDNGPDRCIFTVRVWELGSLEPVDNARLELRIFFVYDFSAGKEVGNYRDYVGYTDPNGEFSFTFEWKTPQDAGDVWWVDVYASKEGYTGPGGHDYDWTNTHVTGGNLALLTNATQATNIATTGPGVAIVKPALEPESPLTTTNAIAARNRRSQSHNV